MAFPIWVLGVILVILGSLGNNYGNNLVSLGHSLHKEKTTAESSEEDKADEKSRARWRLFGVIIIVVGNLATFASFGFAAQSLLAALESVQFLSNVAFAKLIHKEKITRRIVISTLGIVVGNVLVVIFAEHHAILFDSGDIIRFYRTNSAYHAYLVIAFTLFFAMHFLYIKYYNARVLEKRKLWKHSFVEPFAYSVSAAIMGTQAVLNAKCMSMLIQVSSTTSRNEFERPTIWVILVTWIFFVAYWLRRLDKGLELFPPAFIIPVLQVFFVFFAILCGGIFFEEFNTFGAVQWIGFLFGVVFILGGVFGLAPVDESPVQCNIVVPFDELPQGNEDVELGFSALKKDFVDNELNMMALVKITEKPAPAEENTPAVPDDSSGDAVMDPAELAVKMKRTIVKRPTEPVEVPADAAADESGPPPPPETV